MTASDEGECWPAFLRFDPLYPDADSARAAMDRRLAELAPSLRLAATILAYSDSGLEAHLRSPAPNGPDGRALLLQLDHAMWALTALTDTTRAAQLSLFAILNRIGVAKG